MSIVARGTLALALTGSLVACGGASSGVAPSPTAVLTASPVSNAHVITITTAQDKQTVTAHVGDTVQIALGTQYDWRLDPPDGVVLAQRVPANYLLVRGTQALWEARSAGTSLVRATGTVVCPSGQACIQIAILFSAAVEVLP